MASQLPTLTKHKKKLLGPISSLEIRAKMPFHKTSWSDSGFYEYLWLGLLLQKISLSDAIDFAINLGITIASKGKNIEKSGAHWSYIHLEKRSIFRPARNQSEQQVLIAAWDSVETQTLINDHQFGHSRLARAAQEFKFIRKLCDKENPLALKVMFLSFIVLIYADRLKISREMLIKLDPFSLDDYPNTDLSCSSAGMLRAYINAHSAFIVADNDELTPLPLWKLLSGKSACE